MVENKKPCVALVIVTRDRQEELRGAIMSCLAQDYDAFEVLVYDDGSKISMVEAFGSSFPEVKFERTDQPVGYVIHRNRALQNSQFEYVFWIDDDAYYTDTSTVSRVVEQFEANPKLGAIAIPFIEPNSFPAGQMQLGYGSARPRRLRGFTGTATALRRSAVVEAGGLREELFAWYGCEERDLAIRLLEHGYEIGYAETEPIVHLKSQKRDMSTQALYGVRNAILFDWLNLPLGTALFAICVHSLKLFCYKLTLWSAPSRAWFVLIGLIACCWYFTRRSPVSFKSWQLYRRLPGHGPEPTQGEVPGPCIV